MTLLLSFERARRAAFPVALCVGLAAVLTGCAEDPDEGTNGVGKLSAAQIEKKAQTAAGGADSVRLSGALVVKGETYKLNMRLKETGGMGSVSSKDSTFMLLRVGDALYLKADAGFWSHTGEDGKESAEPSESDAEVAGKLQDKYVKIPRDDPSYQQMSGFTDMKVLLDGLLTLHGTVAKGDRDKIGGVRTIKITGGEGDGGTLDVALEGDPYPLQLVRAGGAGTLTLADWGKDFALEAPAKGQTVDYGSRLPGGGE
ncbi:hypothetical protein [Streptomyces sp. NPDC051569]|uniref:hypothetical protein n=1 Tax=Streptomyces sp. NPDC051569 TaxID=3365661 RepID=UPI0037ADCCCA